MTKFRLLNGNVLIKIRKPGATLQTKSGIIIAGVEQDTNKAIVVDIPEERVYITTPRDQYGTPERDEHGQPLEVKRHIDFNVGDKVLMEKRFHHEYDIHHRDRIDHTISVNHLMPKDREDAEVYDYFITHADDIYGVVTGEIGDGDLLGELYTIEPPKAIQKSSRLVS